MTLAARLETAAIEAALPAIAKHENEEVRNGLFFMSNMLPITAEIDFNFSGDAPIELLNLQEFWECRQTMANDYVAIWQLWVETISPVVALEWWNAYDKRSGALRADPVFQASEAQLTADPN